MKVYPDEEGAWCGWLEGNTRPVSLQGGGELRPADGLELALRLAEIEESCGSIPQERLDPSTMAMLEKFSRWEPTARDGQLARLLTDTARRLLS